MPVEVTSGRITMQHPKGATVEVLFYGATVISWKAASPSNADIQERLFVSSKSFLDGSKPVRGGIPIVFPCFGTPIHPDHANLSQHGFARNSVWSWEGVVMDNETGVSVMLSLEPNNQIASIYTKPFYLSYVISLTEHQLSTDIHVKNTSISQGEILEFQALLHNYISVPASTVEITPLQNLPFYDKTEATEEGRSTSKVETRTVVDVKNYTDSIYEHAPNKVDVTWPRGHINLTFQNFKDLVIWNPQQEVGSKMADMEIGGWEKYVCVEPGWVRGFVKLLSGNEWIGRQILSVI